MEYLWLGFAVWLGFTAQAVTGFGSMVIAVSLGSLMFSIPALLPILVPLNIFMTGGMAWQLRRQVDWSLLIRMILPLMVLGMGTGIWLLDSLPQTWLKTGFALLVLWFSGRELLKLYRRQQIRARSDWWQRLWMFCAGIAQGLYGSGGPLLVYGISSRQLDKATFRATLVSVWFVLNSLYSVVMLFQGRVQPVAITILACLPILYLAVKVGDWLHHRVDERQFKLGICLLLIFSALAMLVG
ncbi:sulfite exporter TauE/SafE family protein [Lacimicrobium alkaliphilum]|uniref:Probable membrane transporter protein n=1 Tax=Lacimicrobium alkaliphilum TaxID=1526571 RepID=A0A0U2ZLU8_9ALTE|nr:sulfite exporter TauE/SafE family protein [Lacimicrobium alkaliphilum]ALS99292.1 hypothetical protein AT746_14195 [Lacimicrobium alkaliphilum]